MIGGALCCRTEHLTKLRVASRSYVLVPDQLEDPAFEYLLCRHAAKGELNPKRWNLDKTATSASIDNRRVEMKTGCLVLVLNPLARSNEYRAFTGLEPSAPSPKSLGLRCVQNGSPARREEGAYLDRYVTDEQRSSRAHFQRNPLGRGRLAVFPPPRRIDRYDPDSGASLAP